MSDKEPIHTAATRFTANGSAQNNHNSSDKDPTLNTDRDSLRGSPSVPNFEPADQSGDEHLAIENGRALLPVPVFKTPARTVALKQSTKYPQVKKRHSDDNASTCIDINQDSSRKRLRRKGGGIRPSYPSFEFVTPPTPSYTPSSPLFFSNSPNPRPRIPPRFSSSEAAASMLSKAQREETDMRATNSIRGLSTSASASPTPRRIPSRSRLSVDRWSATPDEYSPSPDDSIRDEMLAQIGLVELLEYDNRPTFVVDTQRPDRDAGNFSLLFANLALRNYPILLDSISGNIDLSASNGFSQHSPSSKPTVTFEHYRSWILTIPPKNPIKGPASSTFDFGGISWSCSTIRDRFRIVYGTVPHTSSSSVFMSRAKPGQSVSRDVPALSTQASFANPSLGSFDPKDYSESADYFGNATVAGHDDSKPLETSQPGIVTSIERAPDPSMEGTHGPRKLSTDNQSTASVEAILMNSSASNLDPLSVPEQPLAGFFDWTRVPYDDFLPKHIQFARSIDWAKTSLGPMNSWSPDLRQMCNLIMASPHPAAMYWGDDLVAIYNEAYVLLAGQKHPALMGQKYSEAWAEIWDDIKQVFAEARSTGQATMKDDDCLFIKRNDFLEETYFSWSIIPMVGADGSVQGLYNPAFEKTRRKIAERRMLTLREVGERTAAARDVSGFWTEVLTALSSNDYDTPFVLLYSLSQDNESDSASMNSSSMVGSRHCILEGSLGIPDGHPAAESWLDLQSSDGFVPMLREVLKTNKPTLVDFKEGRLPMELIEGLEERGFGDSPTAVVICPIHPTTGESTLGFLIMGINPRRPYDDDYSLFVQLLSRQLATSLASVVLFEEEIKRGQRAAKMAALDKIELSEQLAARTQEAIESETKFTRMAEFAPVGMFIADSTGRISYCNDTWYEITRVPRDRENTDRWMEYVVSQDQPLLKQLWGDLVQHTKPATAEFRFKAPWTDRTGVKGETWALFSAYPEKYDDGALKSVFASITNISQQKWAEGLQKRKMEEAVELKRQQENFIDTTSHEMRNPLSAMLQCADEIISSLGAMKEQAFGNFNSTCLEDSIDAAQTIALCAQHQKRIVDDVLTLSKLDSALLMVTPVDVQPVSVVQKALKMFESELHKADIEMKFIVDDSFHKHDVDWVRFDPSRVLQVLINLTTNAIKFTTSENHRTILVRIGASTERPSIESQSPVNYFPSRSKRTDLTQEKDWGDGGAVFIHFAVQDTGRGLNADEKKLLFLRFSQATPRTHVQYGGSGLGLFISRELVELQGGQIGVASEAGNGSTFAFYIKARRTTAPEELLDQPFMHARRMPTDGRNSRNGSPVQTPTIIEPDASLQKTKKTAIELLIVEDNLVNQKVLEKQLTKLGFRIHVANHGGEALECLEASRFWHSADANALPIDLVLMDQEMPVMDGLTCTRKIRELERQGQFKMHVPIIAVTANARSEQIETALHTGMDDVVSKPFRMPDLLPKIEKLFNKYF